MPSMPFDFVGFGEFGEKLASNNINPPHMDKKTRACNA